MTFDPDRYLDRVYSLHGYNCWSLVREAWRDMTGEDLGDRNPEQMTSRAIRAEFDQGDHRFSPVARLDAPGLVVMHQAGHVPHVGLYWRGRVLQINHAGVSCVPVDALRATFARMEFYRRDDSPVCVEPGSPG